jgi:DNA mismatch repair protein MSH3
MAAKLQEEMSKRDENKLLRLMDEPSRDGPWESSPEVGLLCAEPHQGLMEACRRILRDMRSAQSNNDVTNTLSCLKSAQEIASKMIKG